MSILKDAINLILPGSCIVCKRLGLSHDELPFHMPDNLNLCADCLSKLVPIDEDRRWLPCLSEPFKGDLYPGLPLYVPFTYDDFFDKAIPIMKFKSNQSLAVFLGRMLGSVMVQDDITVDCVVPVPLSAQRLKERGFNQAGVIGRECAQILGATFCDDVLVRLKNTKRQTSLSGVSDRSSNVADAFRVVSSGVRGKVVMLVDDVATTGSTLHEAAVELYKGGASKVLCVALCGNRSIKNAEPF
ncbi:MAG: hypothetical protein MJ093_06790 [Saccharofermentans sp.]|nr:hypothetical protein [Saccharofermentans sp.]